MRSILALSISLLLFSGCDPSGPGASISGNWDGPFAGSENSMVELELRRSGSLVLATGSMRYYYVGLVDETPLEGSGTFSNGELSLTLKDASGGWEEPASYVATLAAPGRLEGRLEGFRYADGWRLDLTKQP